MSADEKNAIIQIQNLKTWFLVTKGAFKKVVGYVKAVDGVSLKVYKGEALGIVGESGCGKSTLGKTIMLLEKPTGGKILYNDNGTFKDVTQFNKQETFAFRKKVQMVFQDPYSALNPQKKIYTSFEEPLKVHGVKTQEEREAAMQKVLKMVNIQPEYLMRYPHQFSGGQRQRLCIARALVVKPDVLICDEPVSALDVSIQAQVLNLMKDIQKELHLTYLFIAHDLSVVQYMSDRIVVMYLGKIVEIADSKSLYDDPLHPYTRALLSAIPVPDIHNHKKRIVLEGETPSPIRKPSGCAFHSRCPNRMEICKTVDPALLHRGQNGHMVACHLYDDKVEGKSAVKMDGKGSALEERADSDEKY